MNMTDRGKLTRWMKHALALRDQDRRMEAVDALGSHAKELRRLAPGAGLLATLYFELDDFRNAAEWFAHAARLSPKSEKASLGLFHSLWELGHRDQAMNEMRRFLGVCESTEYSRLLRDLRHELLPETDALREKVTARPKPAARLSLDDRITINSAERAGLLWRKTRKLTPVPVVELQNA